VGTTVLDRQTPQRVLVLGKRGASARDPAAAKPSPFRILEFRPVVKASLRGFAVVDQANGVILRDVSVHREGRRLWAMPPARTLLDAEGRAVVDPNGRRVLVPMLVFASTSRRLRWERAVIDALRESHPAALRLRP
jgi:hypothetical protein